MPSAIPREIVDPEASLTDRQRANRAYYLRHAAAKREAARLHYWANVDAARRVRRERYRTNGT